MPDFTLPPVPPDCVYETLRTHGETICELAAHLTRLDASARALDIPLPPRAELTQLLARSAGPDRVLRLVIRADGKPELYSRSVQPGKWGRAVSLAVWEDPGDGPPGFAKHGQRQRWLNAQIAAGVDEILRVDRSGFVLEAGASNILAVVDGVIRTPPLDGRILPGITRGQLLALARERRIPISEEPLPVTTDWQELGLSSSLKGVAPVSTLDGVLQPGLGPVLLELQAALDAIL
jgi:para-aminobenzoate synthetase/4-amino-4-deoxychorismate lyase